MTDGPRWRATGSAVGAAAFLDRQPFPLDPFQLEALDSLDAGRSVLVAAPTGSGKTVVAEYAVDLALAGGGKAFYTTPIKALSNQKFGDLRPPPRRRARRPAHRRQRHQRRRARRRHDHRGAPQHDLRRSPALRGLRYVILDEVHYLQDHYRGPVWEEVIIHLPPERRPRVPLGDGVERRGARRLDHDGARPLRRRDRGAATRRAREPLPRRRQGLARPPPAADARRRAAQPRGQPPRRRVAPVDAGRPDRGRPRRRFFTPNRLEVVDRLAERGPAPGDLLHLQPGGVRRRRRHLPRRRRAPHHARRAGADPRDRRGAHRRASPTPTSVSGLRPAGWRRSRPASPPTTPAWSRRSRRRSRRASPRGS